MCEDALRGTGSVPAEERSDAMQAAASDPAKLLRGLGALTAEIAPRIAPLLLLLATVAEGDPALAELQNELEDARLARMTHVARTLASKTPLRAGRTVAETADIMWIYTSPEFYRMLVLTRGWAPERYGGFVGDSLIDALLESDRSTNPSTTRRRAKG